MSRVGGALRVAHEWVWTPLGAYARAPLPGRAGAIVAREASRTGGPGPRERETLALARMDETAREAARTAAYLARNAVDACPRGALEERLAAGPPAARQARAGPDGVRPAPRPHRGAAEAARVPGRRAHGRADHRRLHRARGRSERPLGHPPGALGRGDRRARAHVRGAGDQGAASPTTGSRCASTPSGSTCRWRTSSGSCAPSPSPRSSSATTSPGGAAASEPISMLELLYPVLQGYDSVAVARRRRARRHRPDVQPADGPRDPVRLRPAAAGRSSPCRCWRGTDGVQKMSKSLGNHIGITEPPGEMYGKTLRVPDAALAEWYDLLLGSRAAGGRVAARRQARARARAGGRASTARRPRPRPRRPSTACSSRTSCPQEIEEAAAARRQRRRAPARADRRRCSAARARRRGASWPRAA